MDKKTIVVVGAGQGLGNHVAKRFGKEGFRVVLMAPRNAQREPHHGKPRRGEHRIDR